MNSLRFAASAILGWAAVVAADPATGPAGAGDSPRAALKAQDAAAKAGHVEEDLAFYQTDDDAQRKLARVIAQGDVAVAKLEKAVAETFGKDSAGDVVRAAGSEDESAIDGADEKIDGDHATLRFKISGRPLAMVRSNGKWKISLSAWLQGLKPEQIDKLSESVEKLTAEIVHVADLVAHEKFRSAEGVRDRIQRLHDGLFGAPPQ